METTLSDTMLSGLSDFVAGRMGLHFPRDRWQDLERGIASAGKELGFSETVACAEWMLSASLTREQFDVLASHLTIGETYFFREEKSLDFFCDRIIPDVIRLRHGGERHVRVWSAGCSTGEEAYTLAMLLKRILPADQHYQMTIVATDINSRALKKAAQGIYRGASFRATPEWQRTKYFRQTDEGRLEIVPEIKRMVTFSYINLVEDAYPSLLTNTNAMDVIFCRNVLMYMSADTARQIVAKLHRSLVDGGWLIVSPSESSHELFGQFARVPFSGGVVYRKDRRAPVAPEKRAVPTVEAPPPELLPPAVPQPQSYARATELYEQGRHSEAQDALLASFVPAEKASQAWSLLARIHADTGNLDRAEAACRKAIDADKLDPRSHYLLAILLQEMGRLDDAAGSLRRALYLDQDFVIAHVALANLRSRQGDLQEAARHYGIAQTLLARLAADEVVPESEGMTAGRLIEIVPSMRQAA